MTITPAKVAAEFLLQSPLFVAGGVLAVWIHTTGGCQ